MRRPSLSSCLLLTVTLLVASPTAYGAEKATPAAGTIKASCAPWDGPMLSAEIVVSRQVSLHVGIWRDGLNKLLPDRTLTFLAAPSQQARNGYLQVCANNKPCQQVEGSLTVGAFERGKSLSGTITWSDPDKPDVETTLPFTTDWQDFPALCG
jgi:hypothetical protein